MRSPDPIQPPALLGARLWFPDPRKAPSAGPLNGLVAIGGDLSVERLLLAYRSGLFPWTAKPVTWWSPDPRGIFELERFHVPRSLARLLRRCALRPAGSRTADDVGAPPAGRRGFEVTFDRAFQAVMEGCAEAAPNRRETWVTREFIAAYTRMHEAGHAHSVECWRGDRLVGGVYGVALGGFFSGESMFHRENDASKVALFHLVRRLREQQFLLFDVQMLTPITERLGAVHLPRAVYLSRLAEAVGADRRFGVA